MINRKEILNTIRKKIEKYGWYQYCVIQSQAPRFCYTIGLSDKLGFELIFAGGYFYNNTGAMKIVDNYADFLLNSRPSENKFEFKGFSLRKVRQEWSESLMLGTVDYYKDLDKFTLYAKQIIPPLEQFTLDIPDMSLLPENNSNLPWKWWFHEWPFSAPEDSTVVTDIEYLRTGKALQIIRWEENQWECFSRDPENVAKENIRIIPLGVAIGLDPSLENIFEMEIEEGFLRNDKNCWEKWG